MIANRHIMLRLKQLLRKNVGYRVFLSIDDAFFKLANTWLKGIFAVVAPSA